MPDKWKRLQAARILGFFLALFPVLSYGMQGLVQLSPVLAVVAVAGCYRLIVWLKKLMRKPAQDTFGIYS